jgi:outer membrane lipoprotein-sorting protein
MVHSNKKQKRKTVIKKDVETQQWKTTMKQKLNATMEHKNWKNNETQLW